MARCPDWRLPSCPDCNWAPMGNGRWLMARCPNGQCPDSRAPDVPDGGWPDASIACQMPTAKLLELASKNSKNYSSSRVGQLDIENSSLSTINFVRLSSCESSGAWGNRRARGLGLRTQ
ncbi:unnamed protein product [Calypogeia fissa]